MKKILLLFTLFSARIFAQTQSFDEFNSSDPVIVNFYSICNGIKVKLGDMPLNKAPCTPITICKNCKLAIDFTFTNNTISPTGGPEYTESFFSYFNSVITNPPIGNSPKYKIKFDDNSESSIILNPVSDGMLIFDINNFAGKTIRSIDKIGPLETRDRIVLSGFRNLCIEVVNCPTITPNCDGCCAIIESLGNSYGITNGNFYLPNLISATACGDFDIELYFSDGTTSKFSYPTTGINLGGKTLTSFCLIPKVYSAGHECINACGRCFNVE